MQPFDIRLRGAASSVPGFCDCHNHAPGTTLLYDVIVGNPYDVEYVTIKSIVEKLEDNVGALGNLDFGSEELTEIDGHATDADINLWKRSSDA